VGLPKHRPIQTDQDETADWMNAPEFEYDVAFSFASEDKNYVERVVDALRGRARVFFASLEPVTLWGEDLYVNLDKVYREKSRFCVMFISRHYAEKWWTNHERRSAQARALENNQVYILPARFDDTEIPGVLDTIGHIDLRQLSPEQFAAILMEKIEGSRQAAATVKPSRWGWLRGWRRHFLLAGGVLVAPLLAGSLALVYSHRPIGRAKPAADNQAPAAVVPPAACEPSTRSSAEVPAPAPARGCREVEFELQDGLHAVRCVCDGNRVVGTSLSFFPGRKTESLRMEKWRCP
jgi:TIR domain-containing protein